MSLPRLPHVMLCIHFQCKPLIEVKGKNTLIKKLIQKKTGKQVTSKDLQNLSASLRKTDTSSAQAVVKMLQTEYPEYSYKIHCEGDVVKGLMIQSDQMRTDFAAFPELQFADSTYRLNSEDIPLFALVGADGEGHTRAMCLFLVTDESQETLLALLELFKKDNPNWIKVKVVVTDKDMAERNCFKMAMPQIKQSYFPLSWRKNCT